jgi:TonB family protein
VYCPECYLDPSFDERSLSLTLDTSPLTRAAADGDATAVRTLLAEGRDVDVKTPKGQTPLILAAFFGHAGVVRVLLEAGADMGMKDSLGLTAMEWSLRRGFSDVIQIFQNTPAPDPASVGENGEEESRTEAEEAEEARRSIAEETRREAEQEARLRTAEEARIRAEQERKKAAEPRFEAEASSPCGLPAWGPSELEKREAEAEARRLDDELRAQAEEESREKVEEEKRRIAEAENRRIAEEENRRIAEEEKRRIAEAEKRGQTISQAPTLESTANRPVWDSDTKRCPKCNRVYRSDLLAYCSYDSARLLREDDASFRAVVKTDASPWSTLWVLVMITLLGSATLGYLVSDYISSGRSTDALITEKPRANVEQDQPIIGGTLRGKETTLPNPEYPAGAKSQGISGKVTVAVLVNKKGIVVSARALNGDPLLILSAVNAARKAQFSPEKLTDQRSRKSGTITYNFKL